MQGVSGEFSRIQNVAGNNNKKSEFFGFFGYPYGYYGYGDGGGGGGGYGGGYYDYPYDSYPYNWSRWWYNNNYGEKDGPGIKIIVNHYRHEKEHRLANPGIVTKEEAELAAKWFAEAKINVYDFISGKTDESKFQTWRYALQEEAAHHGSLGGAKTNVTNDDLLTTAKIAFAHFQERSDYYHRLYEFVLNERKESNLRQPGIQTQISGQQQQKNVEKTTGMQGLPSKRQQIPANNEQSCYYYYSY